MPQHRTAGRHAEQRRPAIGGVDGGKGDPGIGHCLANRRQAEFDIGRLAERLEPMEADPDDMDGAIIAQRPAHHAASRFWNRRTRSVLSSSAARSTSTVSTASPAASDSPVESVMIARMTGPSSSAIDATV